MSRFAPILVSGLLLLGGGALVAEDAGKATTAELKDVSQITDDELSLIAPPPAWSAGLWGTEKGSGGRRRGQAVTS